ARLAAVVAVHRHGPGRVAGLPAGGPAGQVVQAEVVLRAVGGGDPPVLAVVVAVGGAGELLHLRAVVGLGVPRAGGGVLDQLGGVAVEHQAGVVVAPAVVAGLRADAVVAAAHVAPLDIARPVVEALAHPGHLVVGGRGAPVGAAGGVTQR